MKALRQPRPSKRLLVGGVRGISPQSPGGDCAGAGAQRPGRPKGCFATRESLRKTSCASGVSANAARQEAARDKANERTNKQKSIRIGMGLRCGFGVFWCVRACGKLCRQKTRRFFGGEGGQNNGLTQCFLERLNGFFGSCGFGVSGGFCGGRGFFCGFSGRALGLKRCGKVCNLLAQSIGFA